MDERRCFFHHLAHLHRWHSRLSECPLPSPLTERSQSFPVTEITNPPPSAVVEQGSDFFRHIVRILAPPAPEDR